MKQCAFSKNSSYLAQHVVHYTWVDQHIFTLQPHSFLSFGTTYLNFSSVHSSEINLCHDPQQVSIGCMANVRRALRQAGFVSLQMDPCVWMLPALSPVKSAHLGCVPTTLRTTVADSSVSPVPEIRTDRWKRERNVQGVLGVHVDDLVGGGNLTFQKAVQWLRTELEFGTWDQSLYRFPG